MNFNTEWRKTASSIYRKPVDSKIFAALEMDVTDLEKFISKKRKEGLKITLTHIFTLAVARALRNDVPEMNCYIKRGNVVLRESVDAMVSVLINDTEMGSVRINNADKLSLTEFQDDLKRGIKEARSGLESNTMQMKTIISRIPWPFRSWFLNFIKWLTVNMGVSIPALGLGSDNFGSFMVTNIGSLGLESGYPALFPISNVSMVIVLGGVAKKPTVVNDKIEIRRIISLSATLDHRLIDASHGGKLFKVLKDFVRNPEKLEIGVKN